MSDVYRSASIYVQDRYAGRLSETENGYMFFYCEEYLKKPDARAVSLTLPLCKEPYESTVLFPFFDGIIPEGWLYETVVHNWKLNRKDRFGVLLKACRDSIGDVSVISEEKS